MISHVILFTVLSVLSAVAINAAAKPVSKSLPEQQEHRADETRDPLP